jgi:hypothetical protein
MTDIVTVTPNPAFVRLNCPPEVTLRHLWRM